MSESKSKHPSGLSLIELMVTVAVMGIVMMAFMHFFSSALKSTAHIESKTEQNQLVSHIQLMLSSKKSCERAILNAADVPITFNPPDDDVPHTADFRKLKVREDVILSTAGSHSYSKWFGIDDLKITSNGTVPAGGSITLNDGTVISVKKYFAQMNIKLTYKAGHFAGQSRDINIPMSIFVNVADNKLTSCSADFERRILRAEAARTGITIARKGCTDPIPGGATNKLIKGYPVAECNPDLNADGLCDSSGTSLASDPDWSTKTPEVNPHPVTGDNFFFPLPPHDLFRILYAVTFPSRSLGVAPLTGREGRCPANVIRNDSSETNDEVFKICSGAACYEGMGNADGIGCRNLNGWYLKSCTGGAGGVQDAVPAVYYKTSEAIEYCLSDGFKFPHGHPYSSVKRSWASLTFQVAVICEKIE